MRLPPLIRNLAQKVVRMLQSGFDMVRHRKAIATFLSFCRRSQPGFDGSVQPEELAFLQKLVRRAHDHAGPLVEVGTLFGFTTQAIATWKDTDRELITIDNFSWNPLGMMPLAHRDFTRRCLAYLSSHCHTILFEGLSSDFYASYNGPPPAMIFIDASHEYEHVLADITWARQAGVPIIAGHDYSKFWPGVRRAVDESFGTDFKVCGTLWAHVPPPFD